MRAALQIKNRTSQHSQVMFVQKLKSNLYEINPNKQIDRVMLPNRAKSHAIRTETCQKGVERIERKTKRIE